MRTALMLFFAALLSSSAGCAGNARLNGKWLGSVAQKEKTTKVALDLQTKGGQITGTMTLFESEDDTTGSSFPLANARCSNNLLEFIVPITGKIDADAVFFELLVKNRRLEGFGREIRKGAPTLSAVFIKQ